MKPNIGIPEKNVDDCSKKKGDVVTAAFHIGLMKQYEAIALTLKRYLN